MRLSDLRPAPGSHRPERRVGRGHGSGRGKTAGRGTKGQKARSGGSLHRAFNGGQTRLSKRLPFVRGLGNSNTPFRKNYTIINIADLELFEPGTYVTPEEMVDEPDDARRGARPRQSAGRRRSGSRLNGSGAQVFGKRTR